MSLPLATNHVFVDFENVQKIDPTIFDNKTVSFTLLLGPSQKKLDADLVEKLLTHTGSVQLIRLTEPGRNALDFALAYYLGRTVLGDPAGFFHIVSMDKGYDPLIQHLRGQHVRVRRHEDFSALHFNGLSKPPSPPAPDERPAPAAPTPTPKPAPAPTTKPATPILSENATRLLEYLRKNAKNRPGRERTLIRHIRSFFGDKITEADASSLIENLQAAGYLHIDAKGKLAYHRLPSSPAT